MILWSLCRGLLYLTFSKNKLSYQNHFSLFLCSEEIAFYQGNRREQTIILATFDKLVSFVGIYKTVQHND